MATNAGKDVVKKESSYLSVETKTRIVTIQIIKSSSKNLKNRIALKESKAKCNRYLHIHCYSDTIHSNIYAINLAAHQQKTG